MEDKIYKIMIVEDDSVDAMSIARTLDALLKNKVTIFETVADAISNISSQDFDCYILDYLLPDGTGLEVLEAIRNSNKITPTVMFTGKGSEKIAVSAMKAGLTDYIVKSEMLKSMQVVVDLVKQGDELDLAVQDIQSKFDKLKNSESGSCG